MAIQNPNVTVNRADILNLIDAIPVFDLSTARLVDSLREAVLDEAKVPVYHTLTAVQVVYGAASPYAACKQCGETAVLSRYRRCPPCEKQAVEDQYAGMAAIQERMNSECIKGSS